MTTISLTDTDAAIVREVLDAKLIDPRTTLDEVRFVMPIDRVLVVTALGTLTVDEVRRLGYPAVERLATVGEIVAATAALMPVTCRNPRNRDRLRPDGLRIRHGARGSAS